MDTHGTRLVRVRARRVAPFPVVGGLRSGNQGLSCGCSPVILSPWVPCPGFPTRRGALPWRACRWGRALLPESEGRRPDERVQPEKKTFLFFVVFQAVVFSGRIFSQKSWRKVWIGIKNWLIFAPAFGPGTVLGRGGKDEGESEVL